MGKNKLERFRENLENPYIIEPGKEIFQNIKGNWNSAVFGNQNPLFLELACGRGEYTIGLSRFFPEKNFIGVDIKGSRIWNGGTFAQKKNIPNVRFLRIPIDLIENFFTEKEVSGIWITFPDPYIKKERKRLTSPRFLESYKKILQPNAYIYFKTDNTILFEYTLKIIQNQNIQNLEYTFDLYNSSLLEEQCGIQTNYEKIFMKKGEKIKYLKFQFY